MLIVSLIIAKIVLFGLRLIGRKGSALPGLVIEKLYPGFLARMLGQLEKGVVIVTGTNGKTTTTKILSDLLEAHGLRVLTNKTGSNFVRGTISTIADGVRLSGRLPYDIAVIEQDEAHAVHFVNKVRPTGVVALNIMRDQMDRFGEIDITAKMVGKVAAASKEWVVLNANDARIAAIAKDIQSHVVWFGHSEALTDKFVTDDQHHHQDNLDYFLAAKPDVMLSNLRPGEITLTFHGNNEIIPIKVDGTHNAVNVAAALAALSAILPDAPFDMTRSALADIEPAFGRGERIRLKNGNELRLQLVKNPSGFTHALRLLEEASYGRIGIAINDDFADGRDVSWLWDVEFQSISGQKSSVLCGGTRAFDMAIRLKYDEVKADSVVTDLSDFLSKMAAPSDKPVIIYCTYTAMLALRKSLRQHSDDIKGSIL